MKYRGYEITDCFWVNEFAITYNRKRMRFKSLDDLKFFVDCLYI